MSHDDLFGEQPLDIDDYANQLLEQGVEASPSQLHGAICGVLAGGHGAERDYDLALVSQALDIELRGELAESSLRLIAATEQALGNEDFEFHLFLPDDDMDIGVRVQALGDWCRGFMAAYALVLVEPEGAGLGEEVAEILKDIGAIADVGLSGEEDDEEAEGSYFEITEYLRFATLNLYLDNDSRGEAGD